MSNWLANGTGIHLSPHHASFNRDQFGNLLKNVAPAAFLIPGIGPGMAAGIGGLGSALGRGIQHGSNLGDILKQGASGAAIAGGGAQGMQALRGAFAPSSVAQVSSQGSGFGLPTTTVGQGANGAYNAAQAVGGQGGNGFSLGHALSGVGHFAQQNPTAVGQGLQGIAGISQAGSENRLRNAQANAMEQQAGESAYDFQTRKSRDAALEPLRRALMAQLGQSVTPGYFG